MADSGSKLRLFPRMVGKVAAGYLRWVGRTSTVVAEPPDYLDRFREQQPLILAFWHGQFLLVPNATPRDVPSGVMVARHGDADILGAVLEEYDMELIRGAGAGGRKRDRGGAAALRTSLATLKSGMSIGITADVPPGPARRLGEGLVVLARMSGRPLMLGAVASSRFRTMNSWSRMTFNLPFSRIGVAVGEPHLIPRSGTPEEYEAIRADLEAELNRLTDRAYALAEAAENPRAPLSGKPTPPGLGARLYRGVTRSLEPFGKTILSRRARRGKEDVSRQHERLGNPKHPRPEGRLAWFHAASVGELNAIRRLLHEVKALHPELNLLVTTGTVTSAKIAEEQLSDVALHQYIPLDGPRYIQRFLDHWKPDVAFLVESEIWPNLITETSDRKIPLLLLNATLSDKSAKRWRSPLRKRTAASLFMRFDRILAQTSNALLRFTRLGVMNIEPVGNLKLDSDPPAVDAEALAALKQAIGTRPVFLAASTHPGEDQQVIDAHFQIATAHPDLCTIIVPRHPERGADIETLVQEANLSVVRRRAPENQIAADTAMYIADTIGEMGVFYALSDVTFVGGSLVPHGGQNPIEAIRLETPVLVGPHTKNFADINSALELNDGLVRVADADALAREASDLLSNSRRAEQLTVKATDALKEMEGALEKTLQIISPYLVGEKPDAR